MRRRGLSLMLAGVLCAGLVGAVGTPAHAAEPAPGTQLITNGTLSAGAGNSFDCFQYAGWGTHTAALTSVPGRGGAGRAAQISMSGRTDGDRKLIPTENATCAPAVTPGQSYDLAVWYTATVPVAMTVFRRGAAGWTYWTELTRLPAAAAFTEAKGTTPPIPDGTQQLSWGVSLSANGTLVTDDYSMLRTATGDPTAPTTTTGAELVINGTLAAGGNPPNCMQAAGWGTHTVTQGPSPDIRTGSTGRSWKITLAGYQSGDRKLLPAEAAGCAPIIDPVKGYDISLWYKSSSPRAALTLFRHTAAGWQYWTDLRSVPVAAGWTQIQAVTPAIPAGTDRITFGISTSANGELFTHDYSLKEVTAPAPTAPASTTPVEPADLAVTGRWTVATNPMLLRAVHATLLRDGRVLLLAGSGNKGADFQAGTFKSAVWDTVGNTFVNIPTPSDMFCSGHVTLPDGRVLVAGGNASYPGLNGTTVFKGLKTSYVFDPATNAYTRTTDMADAHWYPTLTKLENGDIWAAGGLNAIGDGTVATEMYAAGASRWLGLGEVPQTWSYWGTYPHMYLLADGRMFYSGGHTFGDQRPGTGASLYNWRTAQIGDIPGLRDPNQRDQAGSVILPPAQNQTVMIAGGGHADKGLAATNKVDIVNLNAANPAYTVGPDLPGPGKLYLNMTTLPDRTVLAANGASGARTGNVLTAAIYRPKANAWTTVAADPIGRNYHSSSLLLADGRVAVFGSNPADGSFELRISVYEPSYLFRGTRPTITAAPVNTTYGASFTLGVTGDIASASLTSPMSQTHQTDTNARLVDLPITGTGTTRTVSVPANRALLPPGPYMLTVLDSNDVPSVATWMNIR